MATCGQLEAFWALGIKTLPSAHQTQLSLHVKGPATANSGGLNGTYGATLVDGTSHGMCRGHIDALGLCAKF